MSKDQDDENLRQKMKEDCDGSDVIGDDVCDCPGCLASCPGCQVRDKRIAELEEHLMSFLVSPSVPDNEIEE